MSVEIQENEIRWIQTGEPHASEVYNRPSRDLREKVNEKLIEVSENAVDGSIVYAIALG